MNCSAGVLIDERRSARGKAMIPKWHAIWLAFGAISFAVIVVPLERINAPTVVVFMLGIAYALTLDELADRFTKMEAEARGEID